MTNPQKYKNHSILDNSSQQYKVIFFYFSYFPYFPQLSPLIHLA
jgi:hypothetical protein